MRWQQRLVVLRALIQLELTTTSDDGKYRKHAVDLTDYAAPKSYVSKTS